MELKETIDSLGTAFEEFKKTNDERIAKLAKGEAVGDLEAKLGRIEADIKKYDELKSRLDEMERRANRPGQVDAADAEYKEGFLNFVRKGDETGIATKDVNITTPADGGYAVPEELDRSLIQLLGKQTPMRQVANVIVVGTNGYKKLANLKGTASGWVDEDDARPKTAAPTLASVSAFMGEIYANPAATQQSLDDIFFDVESWISEEISREFSENENAAFTSGDGVKKPKGFLAYASAITGDATRPFGTVGFIQSGTDGAFNGDNLIDLIYAVKPGYRQNGAFMMSTPILASARKLKDSATGQYLWQPGLQAGEPSQLLGYRVVENDDMPTAATDSLSIAFGDWKRFYTIVDRIGTRMLRDPYTNKPYVQFYTTKRVGGMVENSEAVKLLKLTDGTP